MRYSHLKQIAEYLKRFKKISAIYRVADNILKIVFDKDDAIYFNMQKSNSSIFRCHSYQRTKIYNAPFDVVLAKRFNRSNILDIKLVDDDKIYVVYKANVRSAAALIDIVYKPIYVHKSDVDGVAKQYIKSRTAVVVADPRKVGVVTVQNII